MSHRDGEVIFDISSREVETRSRNDAFAGHENDTPSSRNSWKPQLRRVKSRLSDPPENPDQNPAQLHCDSFDQDIPQAFKRSKLQCLILALIISALCCSLCIPFLKRHKLCGLPLWKWEMLGLVLISGRVVSGWLIRFAVIVIERNFLLKKRVLYFVYGVRKPVQNSIWVGLVLLMWHFIFHDKIQDTTKSRILPYVTKILVCFLVATLIWLLKTLVVKVLALSFHVNNFFERIQEALFSQFVIEMLSGPPMGLGSDFRGPKMGEKSVSRAQSGLGERLIPSEDERVMRRSGTFCRPGSKQEGQKIPVNDLHEPNRENISGWGMRRMVHTIRHGSLTTLDERILNSDTDNEPSLEIRTERQAKKVARKIFVRVAKPGSQYIYLEDLMRYMTKDEAMKTLQQFGATTEPEETGISKTALNDWLVDALRERRALALSLNDTKTAVDKLHNMLNVLVGLVILIASMSILGIRITQFLIFITSQLLLVAFIFGNTCKTMFEAIVFLFVVHPFDVGDRCEVDGIQMVVEEMNILTTIFLRYDNEKVIYPNSILAMKPIVNYYRSPETGDAVDFWVNIATPMEKIAAMKERVIRYIETRSDHWNSAPTLIMRDVEDLNKLRLSVLVTHRMNHQDIGERSYRKRLLVDEMVKILKELDIEYRILSPDVNIGALSGVKSDNSTCSGRNL